MSDTKQPKITLTDDQKAQLRKTGKDSESVELSGSELEERIAPVQVTI